jgi:hypothetical protein
MEGRPIGGPFAFSFLHKSTRGYDLATEMRVNPCCATHFNVGEKPRKHKSAQWLISEKCIAMFRVVFDHAVFT